jgi:hypothetical protein
MALEMEQLIAEATGATGSREIEVVQSLWSGYGAILRYELEGIDRKSLIVKKVSPPQANEHHPRGWNTDGSHQRKLKSYQVESAWYQHYAERCGPACRVPQCLAVAGRGDEVTLLLEDLDASGFPERRTAPKPVEIRACLAWLAGFHATFLGTPPDRLWECGTYWHLETRPDELKRLASEDPALWQAAKAIDRKLKESPFQTLVHGDAKLANFCFSSDGNTVAAVDFQYVGQGCGMKDVAYFIGSCFGEEDCERQAEQLLDLYFDELREAVRKGQTTIDAAALESDWRALYPIAWTDFHRFLKAWSPGHWKIHQYSERLSREVLAQLDGSKGDSR